MEIEGWDDEIEFLQECVADSVVPGICMNPDCEYTIGIEPDCTNGYCEDCETQTVQSALILKGII